MAAQGRRKGSFLKKKNQETFAPWHTRPTATSAACAKAQKFFGSFFQKRTVSSFLQEPPVSLGSLPTLLLLPPLNMMLAATAGAILGRRRFGRPLLAVGLGGLWLLSLPVVGGSLLRLSEIGLAHPPPPGAKPGAIVILSGDQQPARTATGRVWHVGPLTLEREQAGAALARSTGLPVLVTGGALHDWEPTLASVMAGSMANDFGVTVRWQEPASQDTWENARDSAAILHAAGITSVYLVTHAWHMNRGLLAFRRAGLEAVPVPVLLDDVPDFHPGGFLPSLRGWQESYFAIHELIGWAVYALRR